LDFRGKLVKGVSTVGESEKRAGVFRPAQF